MERARALEFKISSDECVGRLLAVLAAGLPAGGRLLEIGTGVGMGTAWVVAGLGDRTDVEVVTVERDPQLVQAVRSWRWPRFVRLLNADVLEVLGSLGSFDLVYADSYSGKYQGLDRTIASLKPGGLLLVDGCSAGVKPTIRAGYVKVRKGFIGKRARTWFSLTREGRSRFERHLAALRRIASGDGIG